jgi:nucleotide-binding universal stress UspA family protein
MFQRILVPLDGATRAEKAIPIAARLARASGGSVVLLQVICTPADTGGFMYEPVVFTQADIDTELSKATKYLTTISLSEQLEGIGTNTVVLVGAVAPSILSAIQMNDIDLVIMNSHGETGLTRWVMGSVAQKIVRHSPVPVLVLRDGGPNLSEDSLIAPRALVSLDGSHLAESAILPVAQLVSALAAPAQGSLHLVRVVTSPPSYERMLPPSEASSHIHTMEHEEEEALTYLRDLSVSLLKKDLAHLNLDITWSVIFEPDVAATLVRMAEKGDELRSIPGCNLIAMATHGRSGLQRWALGSITERTLTATKLPMLIVRPGNVATRQPHAEKEVSGVV